MSPEQIAAICTGLTSLIAALTVALQRRSTRIANDQRDMKAELKRLRKIVLSQAQHLFQLEMIIAGYGHEVPARPYDEEDEDLVQQPPRPAASAPPPTRSRHRRGHYEPREHPFEGTGSQC